MPSGIIAAAKGSISGLLPRLFLSEYVIITRRFQGRRVYKEAEADTARRHRLPGSSPITTSPAYAGKIYLLRSK
jgi:hypothetical protein